MSKQYDNLCMSADFMAGMYEDLVSRLEGSPCYFRDVNMFHTRQRVAGMLVRAHLSKASLNICTPAEMTLLKAAILADTHMTAATRRVNPSREVDVATAQAHAATLCLPHVDPADLVAVIGMRRHKPFGNSAIRRPGNTVEQVAMALHDLYLFEVATLGTTDSVRRLLNEYVCRHGMDAGYKAERKRLLEAMTEYARHGQTGWYTGVYREASILTVPDESQLR